MQRIRAPMIPSLITSDGLFSIVESLSLASGLLTTSEAAQPNLHLCGFQRFLEIIAVLHDGDSVVLTKDINNAQTLKGRRPKHGQPTTSEGARYNPFGAA